MNRGAKRIVITTVGTTGDLQPYLALAVGLKARGHDVRICSHDIHRTRVESRGIDFVSVGPPFSIAAFNRLLDEIGAEREPIRHFEMLAERIFLRLPDRQFVEQLTAQEGADLVVAQRFDYVGQEAAIRRAIPWISATYMPQVFPTDEAPVHPYPRLRSWWTRHTWAVLQRSTAAMNHRVQDVLIGLSGRERPLGIAGAGSPHLNLLCASPEIIEVRSDWPSNLHVTGSWLLDDPGFVPSAPLADFLAKHPSPIVVTFGSMGGSMGKETTGLLLDALARVGHPAIVQAGYSGLGGGAVDRLLWVDYVPHDYLFAHAALVVHHAGSGTSAAACRAGVPSVTVPHLFDQYYWADMLHRIGVAPKAVFRECLTAEVLAAQIEEMLRNEPAWIRAQALGARIRVERGVDAAIELIERLAAVGVPEGVRASIGGIALR